MDNLVEYKPGFLIQGYEVVEEGNSLGFIDDAGRFKLSGFNREHKNLQVHRDFDSIFKTSSYPNANSLLMAGRYNIELHEFRNNSKTVLLDPELALKEHEGTAILEEVILAAHPVVSRVLPEIMNIIIVARKPIDNIFYLLSSTGASGTVFYDDSDRQKPSATIQGSLQLYIDLLWLETEPTEFDYESYMLASGELNLKYLRRENLDSFTDFFEILFNDEE
ncbi:hypothetical protein JXC34_04630 [Candidatus Woesearchaeota archaeon]|nr:hypothetical protein [Candidatus Woesearchaeota archaeon]